MIMGFISDTHCQHDKILDTRGIDVLVHCGDISIHGAWHQINNFIQWFNSVDVKYKIFIAGNHDFVLEKPNANEIVRSRIENGVHYLNDSGVEIEGIKFWGSPVQPWFFDWAFNRRRGEEIKKHWDLIPSTTDVLITHGPPYGILDKTVRGERAGCADLLDAVVNKIKPKIHAFGHIHEAAGLFSTHDTTFINASVLDEHYRMRNRMQIMEI